MTFQGSNLLRAALYFISEEWERICGSEHYFSPFLNTSESWEGEVFQVAAFSWTYTPWTDNDRNEVTQNTTNFWYKDIRIRWYKDILGEIETNIELSPSDISDMLDDCLNSLYNL